MAGVSPVLLPVSWTVGSTGMAGIDGVSSVTGGRSLWREERGVPVFDLTSAEEVSGSCSLFSGADKDPTGDSSGEVLVLGAAAGCWAAASPVEASKLGRELGEAEPRSALARGSVAEKLDLCDAFLAATALASLSCNLSLVDFDGVVDRGGGVGVGAAAVVVAAGGPDGEG